MSPLDFHTATDAAIPAIVVYDSQTEVEIVTFPIALAGGVEAAEDEAERFIAAFGGLR